MRIMSGIASAFGKRARASPAPEGKSKSTTKSRPRKVSFARPAQLVTEHPMACNEEYDRVVPNEQLSPRELNAAYMELAQYVEKEMAVHPSAIESTRHEFLYGTMDKAQEYVRTRCQEVNRGSLKKSAPRRTSRAA